MGEKSEGFAGTIIKDSWTKTRGGGNREGDGKGWGGREGWGKRQKTVLEQ